MTSNRPTDEWGKLPGDAPGTDYEHYQPANPADRKLVSLQVGRSQFAFSRQSRVERALMQARDSQPWHCAVRPQVTCRAI